MTLKTALTVLALLFGFLFIRTPVHALDWIKDLDTGLEEAYERGAPVFIFLTQAT